MVCAEDLFYCSSSSIFSFGRTGGANNKLIIHDLIYIAYIYLNICILISFYEIYRNWKEKSV